MRHTLPTLHHLLGGLLVVAALIGFSYNQETLFAQLDKKGNSIVNIGVEHRLPLSLEITAIKDIDRGMLDILHDSAETTQISVPSQWVLREVRGAPLDTLKKEYLTEEIVRYHVPPDASLSFAFSGVPDSIVVHHSSDARLQLVTSVIDTAIDEIEKTVSFVERDPVEIWKSDF